MRFDREFPFEDILDGDWALPKAEFEAWRAGPARENGLRSLADFIDSRLPTEEFLRMAVAVTKAIGQMHASGIVHRDIRPENLLMGDGLERVWITGFANASRLPRERRSSMASENIEGSLAYMSPEQTGRMNRSVDSRSDLYSLGVTLYQLLTGFLPFSADDPMGWIHCHVARRPVPPSEKSADISAPVDSILLKLLEKSAEDRYQTASGLEHDLRRCLKDCVASGSPSAFPLGEFDVSPDLIMPEALYGRHEEVEALTNLLEEVAETGGSRLVLVSGYSGMGKSSVVNELQRALVPLRGLFATGKFDQYKRDIPYASFVEAFQALVRQLFSKDEAELQSWRAAFAGALGPNAQVIVEVIPELELIIGKQEPTPSLSGPEAQARLVSTFENFVGVFARQEHPLVLFLDDLQWLDTATLDLIGHISGNQKIRHLLLVGAYRDNEVGPDHPLARRLDMIRASSNPPAEISIGGLRSEHVRAMLSDLLRAEPDVVDRLAQVVSHKAGGNPFFILHFLGVLAEEGLLRHDIGSSEWRWDIHRIALKNVSDNVIELVLERLERLPHNCLDALKLAACMGNSIDAALFQHVIGKSERETQELLRDALRAGLLLRVDNTYAFAHDRAQEAAYDLIPEAERASLHGKIGSLLLARDGSTRDNVFDVVDHFNRAALHEGQAEARLHSASLNLKAGLKARSACAYPAARSYFAHGLAHLGDDAWASTYDLAFELSLQNAECTFSTGDVGQTMALVEGLLARASTNIHKSAVYRLKTELHLVMSENLAATRTGLAALRLFGIDFPENPTQQEVEREFEEIWTTLGTRKIESFADLPRMTDPEMLMVMRILEGMWPPSFHTDFNLTTLVVCRMVNISLSNGIAPSSNQGLALLGWIMGPALGRYHEGYAICRLACELADRQNDPLDRARVYNTMGFASSWTQPLSTSVEWYRTAYRIGIEAGDVFFACYSSAFIAITILNRGRDLEWEAAEVLEYLAADRKVGFRDATDMTVVSERASACLRGLTASITDFSDGEFSQAQFESELGGMRAPPVSWFYWTRKIMLHYLAGEFEASLAALEQVKTGKSKIAHVGHVDYAFYGALACAAQLGPECSADGAAMRRRFDELLGQLERWVVQTASQTFAGKHLLVSAEAARLDGRELEAQDLYEQSIKVSAEHGFLQDQAVANEVAARYYARRGFERIATAYLKDARACFQRWGAHAKVRLIDNAPLEGSVQNAGQTVRPLSIDQLDLATVIRVSQAVSSEFDLDKLVDTIMRASIEHAGAERALLLLADGSGGLQVMAEAATQGEAVGVTQAHRPVADADLAHSVIHYVTRAGEPIVVDDARGAGMFADDPHIRSNNVRSLLCLPLANQGHQIGVLYLENNLAPKVFTPNRLTILRLLASQAAISLENTRLYLGLKEREAKIRRLVDANIIGIIIWDRDGLLLDANDAFLRMTQYTKADLENGLGWYEMMPPEWQMHVESELAELASTGAMQAREKELFRRDGSRVRILIGAAAFGDAAQQGVAFILDLTDRERAEMKAVESERRFRELQSDLAHANRVETVGQLSSWIAHDVRQPLVGMVASANAGIQWLSADTPNITAAKRSLQRVEEEGHRAAGILDKVRALMKKSPPAPETLGINELIMETLPLLHSEIRDRSTKVRLDLANPPPRVAADRVQLQQVVMNLVVNAIDAMQASESPRKELTISTTVDEAGNVTTSVCDTGPPLPAERYHRFFEAFYSTKHDGLGMGLAICKNIVENYGGRISAEPNLPRGAAVRFSLPAATASTDADNDVRDTPSL